MWARGHGATEAQIEAARRCLADAPDTTQAFVGRRSKTSRSKTSRSKDIAAVIDMEHKV